MAGREERYVRSGWFEDWKSEQSVSVISDRVVSERGHNIFGLLKDRTAGAFSFLGNSSHSEALNKAGPEEKKSKTRVLDPQGPFLQRWNKIFVISCLFAVFVDPLFLYIPVIDGGNNCLYLDKKLETAASILRFFTDIFYLLHMLFQFRTGFIAPSSRVFGRGVLVKDTFAIAKRYISTLFLVDFLAVLPLPQVFVLVVLPTLKGPEITKAKIVLLVIIICQYVPRLLRIIPLYLQITRSAGIITETAWAGAAFNLIIYMLASHTYLQSASVRIEEMRVKRRDTEQWMAHRLLPENLKDRIMRHEQYRWQETRGVDEEGLLKNLPKDLRREIKRHLCLSLLMKVPMFENMDEQLLDAMCDRLKPMLYTEGSCIIREGDPVNEMLFIMRGTLESTTTNGGQTGFFNSNVLKGGDFCGEELLTWALDPTSASNLPVSTRTVKTLSEVEAFALRADDLKFVATQFRRLHSKQLQHTFRFYSQQWRTWAACFIQAAWHRYCRKKLEEALYEKEKRLQAAIVSDGTTSLSLGAALYASRFAGNMMRILRRNTTRKARLQERVPARLLQKPAEPNFFAEDS
ncbi:cyclic nucleotide-gated ion channel 1-like isoform X3 [Miscanthus floridulus]|uniref:cyclic nucleotide-gated ion channel 1-like isoform X3 n=1 Tax=Miscanthus floridulus TaxID=154761 RepID=UPI00345824A6